MYTLPPGVHGSRWNNISERVVKEGGVHDQEIGFMERTMRFGLFCVAIMYFRARWLLHQQRDHASVLKLGWKIDTSVPVRAQRKRNSQITVFSTQAGYQRVKVSTLSCVFLFVGLNSSLSSQPQAETSLHSVISGTKGEGASRSTGRLRGIRRSRKEGDRCLTTDSTDTARAYWAQGSSSMA